MSRRKAKKPQARRPRRFGSESQAHQLTRAPSSGGTVINAWLYQMGERRLSKPLGQIERPFKLSEHRQPLLCLVHRVRVS
jgi:hypothetical protein